MQYRQLGTTELKVSTVSPGCRQIEDVVVPRCVRHDVLIICYSPLAQGLPADKWQSTGDVREAQARNRMFSYDRSGTKHNVTGCPRDMFGALARIYAICHRIGLPRRPLRRHGAWTSLASPASSQAPPSRKRDT